MNKNEYIELQRLLLIKGQKKSLSALKKLFAENPYDENGELKEEYQLTDDEISAVNNIIDDSYTDFMRYVFLNTNLVLKRILLSNKNIQYRLIGVEYDASKIIRDFGYPIYEQVHNLTKNNKLERKQLFIRDYNDSLQIIVHLGIDETLEVTPLVDLDYLSYLLEQNAIDFEIDLDNNTLNIKKQKLKEIK